MVGGSVAPEPAGRGPGRRSRASTDDQLQQAQAVFRDMQQAYAAGDFVRYGELHAAARQDPLAAVIVPTGGGSWARGLS